MNTSEGKARREGGWERGPRGVKLKIELHRRPSELLIHRSHAARFVPESLQVRINC